LQLNGKALAGRQSKVERTRVLRWLSAALALVGVLLVGVPGTMIHEGPGRFVYVKIGLGLLVSAALCLLLTVRRGPSDRDVPKPSAHWLALASVAIPPIAFWLQALQVFALLASALLGFVALIKVILELTVRKQWRWRRTWLALLLCIAWPIVMKFAPCFDRDPITRRINAMGGKHCYEEMWGR